MSTELASLVIDALFLVLFIVMMQILLRSIKRTADVAGNTSDNAQELMQLRLRVKRMENKEKRHGGG